MNFDAFIGKVATLRLVWDDDLLVLDEALKGLFQTQRDLDFSVLLERIFSVLSHDIHCNVAFS